MPDIVGASASEPSDTDDVKAESNALSLSAPSSGAGGLSEVVSAL